MPHGIYSKYSGLAQHLKIGVISHIIGIKNKIYVIISIDKVVNKTQYPFHDKHSQQVS